MKGTVKYQYAENSSGKLININNINKNERHDEKYICLNCKQELISRLGDIRVHHFSHKNDTNNCSKETYLHKLGKKVFYETYLQCINANEPFYINTSMFTICKYNEIITLKNCKKEEITKFDLISSYKNIEYEKNQGKFIPDITLINDYNEKIFIEIAVTHPCDDEKIKSKNKIIEISIKEESDVKLILEKNLTSPSELIKFYNFEDFTVLVDPICTDNIVSNYSLVLKDGKEWVIQKRKREICQIIYENKDIIINVTPIRIRRSSVNNNSRGGPRIDAIDKRNNSNYKSKYKRKRK